LVENTPVHGYRASGDTELLENLAIYFRDGDLQHHLSPTAYREHIDHLAALLRHGLRHRRGIPGPVD
jgi:hypothetical protein